MRGSLRLKFLTHKLNSQVYVEILRNRLVSVRDMCHPEYFPYQYENVPCHIAGNAKLVLEDSDFDTMLSPASTRALDPMETVRANIVCELHNGVVQLNTFEELKQIIRISFRTITPDRLRGLLGEMKI